MHILINQSAFCGRWGQCNADHPHFPRTFHLAPNFDWVNLGANVHYLSFTNLLQWEFKPMTIYSTGNHATHKATMNPCMSEALVCRGSGVDEAAAPAIHLASKLEVQFTSSQKYNIERHLCRAWVDLGIHMPKHTTCLGRNYYFKTRDFSYHIPEINAQLPCARLVLHGSCVVKDLSACIVLCFHIIPQQIFCLVLTACKYINMSMNFFSKESK